MSPRFSWAPSSLLLAGFRWSPPPSILPYVSMVWPSDTILEYFISSCFCPLMSKGLVIGHPSVLLKLPETGKCGPSLLSVIIYLYRPWNTALRIPLPFLPPSKRLVVLPPWFPLFINALPSPADTPHPLLRVSSFLRRSALRTSRNPWPSDTVCQLTAGFPAMSLYSGQAAIQMQSLSTYVTDHPDLPRFMVGVQQLIPSSWASRLH